MARHPADGDPVGAVKIGRAPVIHQRQIRMTIGREKMLWRWSPPTLPLAVL
jgi:hypothetical protein